MQNPEAIEKRKPRPQYLLLCEFNFYTNNNSFKPHILSRYIDDGFLFNNITHFQNIINNLLSFYPTQIPVAFTSNQHSVHYLDLTISLNYYTLLFTLYSNQTINTCTLTTLLTIANTFFLPLSKQKRYVTVDSLQLFTITISLKIFFFYDSDL